MNLNHFDQQYKQIRGYLNCLNNSIYFWIIFYEDEWEGEDQTTVTEGNAPENMRTIDLLAAKMPREEKTCKKGTKAKQFKAALDNGYLTKVLLAANF